MIKPGTKVFITEDCREGGAVTGQVGVYEGDFARTIALGRVDKEAEHIRWFGEYGYEKYKSGALKLSDGRAARDVFVERKPAGKDQPRSLVDEDFVAVPMLNPRIRLADGSVIWGAECWWCEYSDDLTMDEAQAQTEATKDMLRAIFATSRTEN